VSETGGTGVDVPPFTGACDAVDGIGERAWAAAEAGGGNAKGDAVGSSLIDAT